MTDEPDRDFATEDDALAWLAGSVDDPDADNYRIGYLDDLASMERYDRLERAGCCGSREVNCTIAGRPAVVGCSYGH